MGCGENIILKASDTRLQGVILNMCSSKEDGTYYNQFSRYFTTLYVMIHHKRGGTLRRGYGLKEQEMTM